MQFDPSLYYPIYIYSLLVLSLAYSFNISRQQTTFILQKSNISFLLIYVFLFILFVGLRPISFYFGDTVNYNAIYKAFMNGTRNLDVDSSEWVFEWMQYQASRVMDVHGFFLMVEILYIVPVLWACYRFVPNHYILMFLFCMGAFSFFSYGLQFNYCGFI